MPPDQAQQRRGACRPVLPARLPQARLCRRARPPRTAVLRGARHPHRAHRQAGGRARCERAGAVRGAQGAGHRQWRRGARGGRRSASGIEPHAAGIRALWSPGTGIVDFGRVAAAYADEVRAGGGTIELGREVTSITRQGDEMVVGTSLGDVVARRVIACAGLWADQVAAMTGEDARTRPASCPSGATTTRSPPMPARSCRDLSPCWRLPFLGIHLTGASMATCSPAPTRSSRSSARLSAAGPVAARPPGALAYPGFIRWPAVTGGPGSRSSGATGTRRRSWPRSSATCPRWSEQLVFGPSGCVRRRHGRLDGR